MNPPTVEEIKELLQELEDGAQVEGVSLAYLIRYAEDPDKLAEILDFFDLNLKG